MKVYPTFFGGDSRHGGLGIPRHFLIRIRMGNPLSRRAMHVHESRSSTPDGFVKAGMVPPDTVLNMRIALTQNNAAGLEDALWDVSTPGSALYGRHLTKEQVSISTPLYLSLCFMTAFN